MEQRHRDHVAAERPVDLLGGGIEAVAQLWVDRDDDHRAERPEEATEVVRQRLEGEDPLRAGSDRRRTNLLGHAWTLPMP